MTETSVETTPADQTNEKDQVAVEEKEKVENGNGDSNESPTNETEEDGKEEKKEDQPKEMKSVVLLNFGGYKGVKVLKKAEPTAQSGEVLIRVRSW